MNLIGRALKKTREVGVFRMLDMARRRLAGEPAWRVETFPLMREARDTMFGTDPEAIRRREKERIRTTSFLHEASQVEATYPLISEGEGRLLRYAFLPAEGESKGLVVLFHGHNAFLFMGPVEPWADYDILAPWDTFGWNRQGSWFWGERGDNCTERLLRPLIEEHVARNRPKPWFCLGGSMGGFGALFYGITMGADGIYATAPQVDLRAKIRDYGEDDRDNPYGYLRGDTLDSVPDLLALAEAQETLPPLYLVQRQYDPVNVFAEHGFRLLDVYNRKRAWYGVRVAPAIGHASDGTQGEARYFFSLVAEKTPPASAPVHMPRNAAKELG